MKKEEVENYLHEKIEKGETVSPILPEGIKNYLIDIDGTICDDVPNEEPERMVTAELYPDALETINNWYDKGHMICFFTARIESHREVTEKWLKDNGFKYHSFFNKISKLTIISCCFYKMIINPMIVSPSWFTHK